MVGLWRSGAQKGMQILYTQKYFERNLNIEWHATNSRLPWTALLGSRFSIL